MSTNERLTDYQLRFLFDTYKVGGNITNIQIYSPKANSAINYLQKKGYLTATRLEKKHDESPGSPWGFIAFSKPALLLILTEKGVEKVEKDFLRFLRESKMHLKHSLLIPGDKVRVLQTVKNPEKDEENSKRFVRAPHTQVGAGLYTLASVDKRTLLTFSDETGEKYRLFSYNMREHMILDTSNLGNTQEEMQKRFGRLNVKKISTKLHEVIKDNFKVVKLIAQIQKSAVATNRFGGENV